MNLFIQGGGSGKESYELDKAFIDSIDMADEADNADDQARSILYIPVAADPSKHPYKECLEWLENQFSPFGSFGKIRFEMWTENDLTLANFSKLNKYSGIYIGGGNTFKLVDIFRKSGFFQILRNYIKKGMPVYGGSAGGVIMGRTTTPALSADENLAYITDFSGLDLVNGYDLWFHYDPSMNDQIEEYMKKYDLKKMIAIPENAGLYVTGRSITVIGQGSVTIFPGRNARCLGQDIIV